MTTCLVPKGQTRLSLPSKLRATLLAFAGLLTLFGATGLTAHAAEIRVAAGGDLQGAINLAQPGDRIVLEAGATFVGPFTLPNKGEGSGTDADYITVESSAAVNLPAGARITPAQAHLMARLTVKNYEGFSYGPPVIRTEARAHHYRLVGLEITSEPGATVGDLVALGDGSEAQNTLAVVPHHLVVDRCYVHAPGEGPAKRGIALNSADTQILNSHLSGFKLAGEDSQAVCMWNGPGRYLIENNYLEAAGENILILGSANWIPNLVPSDVTIRRNHFNKPLSWYPKDATYKGTPWTVKNLLELKTGKRVTIEGNLMEHSWQSGGDGNALVIACISNGAGAAPQLEDITVRSNIIRHASSGVTLDGRWADGDGSYLRRVSIENNLFEDIDGRWGENYGRLFIVNDHAEGVRIEHNTGMNAGDAVVSQLGSNTDFVSRNNIFRRDVASGMSPGDVTLNTCFPGAAWVKNAQIAGDSPSYASHPDNYFPADVPTVGFANHAGGNYRLTATSPYKNAATDGKDLGCDFDALEAAMKPAAAPAGPYKGAPAIVPGRIEAEDYDNGGEGVAYHDQDATNNGGQYRADGVDVRAAGASSNGHAVFNAGAGEWLKYTLNVSATGKYDLGVSVASLADGGTFHLELDGVDVSGPLTVAATGGWQLFRQVRRPGVVLSQGTHVLRLVLDANGSQGVVADFDAIHVTPSADSPALVSDAFTAATTLAENPNAGAEQIAPLLTDIEEAYAKFYAESNLFEAAERIDRGLRAALYFTRAAYALAAADGPSAKVQSRLQIAALHLSQVKGLMIAGGGSAAPVSLSAHASTTSAVTSPVIGVADTRSSASFEAVVAPGSLGTILGDPAQSPLSTKTTAAAALVDGMLPYELDGVSVTVGGRAAQVLSVSPSRITFFVAPDLPAGDAEVLVTLQEGYVSRGTVTIIPIAPGIFTKGNDGTGEAVVFKANDFTAGPFDASTYSPVSQDSRTRLTIFTTGLDGIINADTSNDLNILGVSVPNLAESVRVEARTSDARVFHLRVEYAGRQGDCLGLDQVNVVVPQELKGAGAVELTLIAGGRRSNIARTTFK